MHDRPDEVYPRRLHELEQRFGGLMTRLTDSPEKEAFSILHGVIGDVAQAGYDPGARVIARPLPRHRSTSSSIRAEPTHMTESAPPQ